MSAPPPDSSTQCPAMRRLGGEGGAAVPKTIKTECCFLSLQRKTTIFLLRLLLERQG